MSNLKRKIKRTSFKNEFPNIYFGECNREFRRAIKNRRVSNPEKIHEMGSTLYIKAPLR